MKIKIFALIVLLGFLTAGVGEEKTASETAVTVALIEKTVLPFVKVDAMDFEPFLKFVEKELNTKNDRKIKIKIEDQSQSLKSKKVTIAMEKVSVRDLLRYSTIMNGALYFIDGSTIIVKYPN